MEGVAVCTEAASCMESKSAEEVMLGVYGRVMVY